jgi:protein AFG1
MSALTVRAARLQSVAICRRFYTVTESQHARALNLTTSSPIINTSQQAMYQHHDRRLKSTALSVKSSLSDENYDSDATESIDMHSSRNLNDPIDKDGDGECESFLVKRYKEMATNSKVALDVHQLKALGELDRLRNDILSSAFYASTTSSSSTESEESYDGNSSFLTTISSFFQSPGSPSSSIATDHEVPKGVYLHGGVGCGKTFCMDLFHDNLPVAESSKQKVHFHKFMIDVHKQMHEAKMVNKVEGDVLPSVIESIIRRGRIICFDEFQVTDVADALILRRLFTGLLEKGAVIVATSNRPPKDLYLNGLQRDLFLPFIDVLEEKHDVISMWDSDVDYRLVQGENKARGVYFVSNDANSDSQFNEAFEKLTKGSLITAKTLMAQGRSVKVPRASLEYRVARLSFDDLCRKPLGAADYLVIAENFHTVFVEDIPLLSMNDVNLVRRFIVFIDAMYECHVKLIIHAEALPNNIFQVDLDNEHCDEAFAFDRTRSRLEEMGSDKYLKSRWAGSKKSKEDGRPGGNDEVNLLSTQVSIVDKSERALNVDVDDRDHISR